MKPRIKVSPNGYRHCENMDLMIKISLERMAKEAGFKTVEEFNQHMIKIFEERKKQ